MSLNKVMLIGYAGRDAEARYFRSSNPLDTDSMVARFTLATNERTKDGAEITEWHNITAWRASAQFAEKYIKKGVQVYVEGRLHTNSWTDQKGVTHSSAEIFAEKIEILGRKEDNTDGTRPTDRGTSMRQADEPAMELPDDGFPF